MGQSDRKWRKEAVRGDADWSRKVMGRSDWLVQLRNVGPYSNLQHSTQVPFYLVTEPRIIQRAL